MVALPTSSQIDPSPVAGRLGDKVLGKLACGEFVSQLFKLLPLLCPGASVTHHVNVHRTGSGLVLQVARIAPRPNARSLGGNHGSSDAVRFKQISMPRRFWGVAV